MPLQNETFNKPVLLLLHKFSRPLWRLLQMYKKPVYSLRLHNTPSSGVNIFDEVHLKQHLLFSLSEVLSHKMCEYQTLHQEQNPKSQ